MKLLTIDLEEWYHILDNPDTWDPASWCDLPSRIARQTYNLLHLLQKQRVQATFFVLGCVAEKQPDLIRHIAASGHQIGTHSYSHLPLKAQTIAAFKSDLCRSVELLTSITGQRIRAYRAPGFGMRKATPAHWEILPEAGIDQDSSLLCGDRCPDGQRLKEGPTVFRINGSKITEFPVSASRLLRLPMPSSGYFRLLPARAQKLWIRRPGYLNCYFHPRDFDPKQAQAPTFSRLRRWKNRVGTRNSKFQLTKLLQSAPFYTLNQAAEYVH